MKQLERGFFCSTWGLCHKKHDSFSLAIEEDMTEYVNMLHKFV